jgi:hypothetical protein
MQVPGSRSTNVLAIGLHCMKGRTMVGTANMARVAIAKKAHLLGQPSVKRSRVTAKETLLNVTANMDTASPDAP